MDIDNDNNMRGGVTEMYAEALCTFLCVRIAKTSLFSNISGVVIKISYDLYANLTHFIPDLK